MDVLLPYQPSRRLWVPSKVAAFSPDQVAGLETWLEGRFITGLSDGDPVTTWEDSHTSNKDATQGTGAAKPTYKTSIVNGLAVVRFDGTDDYLLSALTNNDATRTVFVVAVQASSTGNRTVWSLKAGGSDSRVCNVSNTWNYDAPATSLGAAATTSWALTTVRFNSTASADCYLGTGSATNLNPDDGYQTGVQALGLGTYWNGSFGNLFWNGDIAAFLVYNSALSDTDKNAVRDYLLGVYGL